MNIGIEAIEYYLPEKTVTSEELAARFGFSPEFLKEKIGVKTLFMADSDTFSSDLAVRATEKLLLRRPEIRDRLGVIAVCTQTPDLQLPHTAALVQEKLGLPSNIATFDLGLGCSGFVYGLSIVKAFMEGNDFEYGLLITAETYSKIMAEDDKNTRPLFSDGAAATLLGRSPALIPGRYTFGTNGSGCNSLIVKRAGKYLGNCEPLHMDGRGVFELVASVVPGDIRKCLTANSLELAEVDHFVFHQASRYMLQTLTRQLGLDEQKVFSCIEQFGNTISSSIPIALKTLIEEIGEVECTILLSGFGVGLSWASTVLFKKGGVGNV